MEVKILMLLALIAAIAAASHVGARSQSQERAN
jgi:type II secretory pathway component PulK